MKVGMNLLLWTAHPTLKEHGTLLESIRNWGFGGVELPLRGMMESDARELARKCDNLGLGRTAIFSLSASEADPASADGSLRRAAVEKIKHALDLTVELGSNILTGPLFQGLGRFTGAPPTRDEWRWAVDAIREAAEHAAKLNIRLALEPLNRFEMYLVNTIADGARFCRDVGVAGVGLLADTFHSNIEEPRPAEAWAKFIDSIYHVHISENDRGIPGRGHAACPEIFAALRQGGYDGWCVIEAFSTKVPEIMPRLHIWRRFFELEEEVAVHGLAHIRRCWEVARE
jgi:D-psicose/D-tagatose/L-ribulose 3-epimerase